VLRVSIAYLMLYIKLLGILFVTISKKWRFTCEVAKEVPMFHTKLRVARMCKSVDSWVTFRNKLQSKLLQI